jgi:Right handed beta helix region
MVLLIASYTLNGGGSGSFTVQDTDSSTAQTNAIQQALNVVATNPFGTGGTVTLSGGTFTVKPPTGSSASDGVLKIGSNTTLQHDLNDPNPTIIKLDNVGSAKVTGIIRTDSGGIKSDGSFETTQNVTIKNLTIDGNTTVNHGTGVAGTDTYRTVDAFYCGPNPNSIQDRDSNILIENVTARNCSGYGFDPHNLTTNLTFRNCTATGNRDGFTIDGCGLPGAGNGVIIENCTASGNYRHGFNVTTGSTNVQFIDNIATGNGISTDPTTKGAGIVVQTGNNEIRDWTDNVTITGGAISGNAVNGIRVTQAEQVTISGVNFTGQAGTGSVIRFEGVRADPDATAATFGGVVSGNTIGAVALTTSNGISVLNYLQTFGDSGSTDPTGINDRWIATSGVTVNSAAAAASNTNATGAPL